ncbi:hypothetical protein SGRIM128S_05837 [Streptomyces griseomycini]
MASSSPAPRVTSDSKRSSDTFSQRNCEPFTPLLSRLLQEQLARVDTSSDLPSLPDSAFGTRSSRVFFDSTLHDSGSVLYAAARTVGDGLADADAEALDALSPPSSEPESEEQPAATSITGTTPARTRTRVRRFARWSRWSR